MPVAGNLNNDQLSERARKVQFPICNAVDIVRNNQGKIVLNTTTPNARIYYSIDNGAFQLYQGSFEFLSRDIVSYCRSDGFLSGLKTSVDFGLFIDKSAWKVLSYSSQASGEEAYKSIDGNESTIWHTSWGTYEPAHPHEIVVDMQKTYRVEAFNYTGRQDGENGRIKEYEIYFSNDPNVWGSPAARENLPVHQHCNR